MFGDRSIEASYARNLSTGATGARSSPSNVHDWTPEPGITNRCTRIAPSISVLDNGR